jgi:predicted choloylglycine hydrolase
LAQIYCIFACKKRNLVFISIIKFLFRSVFIVAELFLAAFFVLFIFILFKSQINPPEVPEVKIGKRIELAPDHYILGNNSLKKNDFGVWEMYLEGDPYERGLIYGELAKELVQHQEDIFVDQINQFVPSGVWQQFLKLFIGFFNSDLPKNIPLENQQEIYGISKSFSDEYDYIAPKYMRILNYHAAHDIGHALNDYSMVGCTSFALKGAKVKDGKMIIGRNFDFYVGDAFAEEKLIIFVNPTKGFKFASYSWAGFTGVASGLNEKGLSVTINASKSDLPTGSRMPISLLAREILQYASTIKEAIAIAKKRNTFVSETLMIGSAKDGKTVLIEKSPTKIGVFDPTEDQLICSNHYQSEVFKNDPINKLNAKESDSKYRYARVKKLLKTKTLFNPTTVAAVLRDQYAENGDTLGMGNPRAVNQLIVHHSVVILPQQKRLYISTSDYQLGAFIGYDLKKTFSLRSGQLVDTVQAAAFLKTKAYEQFKEFKKIKQHISAYLMFDKPLNMSENQVRAFIKLNSESYVTYEMLGKFYIKKGNKVKAASYFKTALTKPVASIQVEKELKNLYQLCLQK